MTPIEPIDVSVEELERLVDEAGRRTLAAEEQTKLRGVVRTLEALTAMVAQRQTTIDQLRALLLGWRTTEKTKAVLGDPQADTHRQRPSSDNKTGKRKGHGRKGAAAYSTAPRVTVEHPTLKPADRCPHCLKGKVYKLTQPQPVVRIKGQPPLQATVYDLEALRCNGCGELFTPPPPDGADKGKYDETAVSMIAVMKYGGGVPFKRLERLQDQFGVPVPAATAWEMVAQAAASLMPVWEELIRQAAQGELVHNDDTKMKILAFIRQTVDRTGLFTTGIVSISSGERIALFFTGEKHAGENLADLLTRRAAELVPPIQMCDALSRNAPGSLPVQLANCLAHARRHFVDVADSFPVQCRYVLETLGEVFHNDELARLQALSPDVRLSFHQRQSGPLMDGLFAWCNQQFDLRQVEPNSGLGKAIRYLLNHWPKLTLFLRVPGAPIDNNICERALKKVVLHRKNSLFYRSKNGASVGDLFMSLIYTAELSGANPFHYLTQLLRHSAQVARAPARWLPWNYTHTLMESGVAA